MTQIEIARLGRSSKLMKRVAKIEGVSLKEIVNGVANGTIVIPNNRLRTILRPCGIGCGLSTKINANIGTSKDSASIKREVEKALVSIKYGADTIMDLSTGPKIAKTRKSILKRCQVPIGTVPIYEIAVKSISLHSSFIPVKADELFEVLENQAMEGVDFFTIHAGVTKKVISVLTENPRILDIVSRGGAFLAEWIISNEKENPFYEYFDRVIDIAKRYDITLSLGDGLRPGSVKDATDLAQIAELTTLGELQKRATQAGVQVMIEGPGHVPIDQIEANVKLEKSLCNGAPFYVLGPLVTDIAPGYDHITSAIGGAIAASKGADFLCYVTPSEHLRLPTIDDVKEGVIASKIAAHAADIAKGLKGAIERDIEMSKARRDRNWKEQFRLAIDPVRPKEFRSSSKPGLEDVCTMCSEYCSIKTTERCLKRGR